MPEAVDVLGSSLFEEGLELGEGHFDGIEIGAVGRRELQLGPGLLDCFS